MHVQKVCEGKCTVDKDGHTCLSTCCIHDSLRSLYLKRQHHEARFGQTGICGHRDAQVRGEQENLCLHQEKGLRCHQKPSPQQGNRWHDCAFFSLLCKQAS